MSTVALLYIDHAGYSIVARFRAHVRYLLIWFLPGLTDGGI